MLKLLELSDDGVLHYVVCTTPFMNMMTVLLHVGIITKCPKHAVMLNICVILSYQKEDPVIHSVKNYKRMVCCLS